MADASNPAADAAQELPPKNDPTHDVPGKLLATWLVGSVVGVFVTVWLLGIVYDFFLEAQRARDVEQAPTAQRDALTEKEQSYLEAGRGRKSVDDALEAYLNR
ncbi:MAG: hypothetical protein AAF196_01600 [Planctomycetota bacterium]